MQVSISEVEKIAMLSRLSFSDEEKQKFQHNLEAILIAAQRLNELDTSNVEPTAHIQGIENVLRADIVQPSMDNDKLTAGAPERENGCFIVPRVVE
ncbi:MAG: Asp-tRNA(Asn)/Glu-tRNA(Gln) amidotransferase subunit GatC [Christensenellaceae bacterium]|nr:Asp-tRNA(Asn)/Glu-tRNA(Gln) amidotransferase subunit GatC [Christensenellaceae bacterium]